MSCAVLGLKMIRLGGKVLALGQPVSGFRLEQCVEPLNGAWIIFTLATNVADQRGEVWDRDQLLVKPGEIGNIADV